LRLLSGLKERGLAELSSEQPGLAVDIDPVRPERPAPVPQSGKDQGLFYLSNMNPVMGVLRLFQSF
jgi:hypothetical protein